MIPTLLKRTHQTLCRVSGLDFQRIIRPSLTAPRVCPDSCDLVLTLRSGLAVELEATQYITQKILRYGCFDPPLAEAILRLSVPGGIHCDVGANAGYMTTLMAGRAGSRGKVFAFEPVPRTFSRLKRNAVRTNDFFGAEVVKPLGIALGETGGEISLNLPINIHERDGVVSINNVFGPSEAFITRTVKLDDILEPTIKIDLIKVDVEGSELSVLKGASRAIEDGRLPTILFEEHGPFPGPSASYLAGHGYAIWRLGHRGPLGSLGPSLIEPHHAQVTSCPPGFEPDPNYVATMDSRGVRRAMHGVVWECI